jgi:hypothetical protein
MNLEQATLELDASTLRTQDASKEARNLAAQDPVLGAWLKKRTLFDEQIAEAFALPAIPADLRDNLLLISKQPKRQTRRWMASMILSAAAAVVLSWAMLWPGSGDMPSWQADSIAAVAKLQYGLSRLDERAPNLEAVKKLLAATSSTTPQLPLPGTLAGLPTYGCKRIQVGYRPATIICFKMPSGHEAHLVVMDLANLESHSTQFSRSKNWNMATWSEGSQTFMLATTSDAVELKRLLGLS